jgi:hypothetical protein
MADDTLRTNPKMHEEARTAAAEVSIPKPIYDPKSVAREEFDRIVDSRYMTKPFDTLWELINFELTKKHDSSKILGVLSEVEYRQLASSFFYGVQVVFLKNAAHEASERADVLHKAALYTAHDRLKISELRVQELLVDLSRGLVRAHTEDKPTKQTCFLHPNGCPEGAEAQEIADFGKKMLEALLGKK